MKFLQNILRFLKFNCLAVLLLTIDEHEKKYELYFIRKKNNRLDFLGEVLLSTDLNLISKKVKNKPVFLCIHGIGIIERVSSSNDDKLTKVENPLENELLSQFVPINDEFAYAAYVKNQTLNEILDELSKNEIKVQNISFGIQGVVENEKLFSDSEFKFTYNRKEYSFESKELLSIQKMESEDEISEHVFSEISYSVSKIIAMSLGIKFYLQDAFNFGLNGLLINNIKELVYGKVLKVVSSYSLLLLFSVLIINFTVNESLEKKGLMLRQEIAKHQKYKDEVEQNSDKIKERMHLLNEMNINRSIPIYHLVDSIGVISNGTLKFNSLFVNPLLKEIRANEKVEIEKGKVQIKGEVPDPNTLGEFIEKISRVLWIRGIEKQYYQQDANSSSAHFELTVDYDETKNIKSNN